MLSNIASFLLGSNNVDTRVALEPDVRLVEADEGEDGDGWVVVHKTSVPEDDADDEILVEVEGEKRNDECEYPQEHHLSVAVSCASLNNSWFVTPPPCFTSTGPIDLETSPFENLLIEHPSMSVYQQRTLPSNTAMSSSTPATIQRASSEPPPEREISFVDVPRNCPTSGTSLQHLKRQQEQLQKLRALAAQKGCERRANQGLKRGQLALRDKARECSQRRHRPRRCERQPRNSAANNNRKC